MTSRRNCAILLLLLLSACASPPQPRDGAPTTGDQWGELYCIQRPADVLCKP